MSEEDAKEILESEDEASEQMVLQEISSVVSAFSKLENAPPEVKEQLGGLAAASIMKKMNRSFLDDIKEFARELIMTKEALKLVSSDDNSEVKTLAQKIDAFLEELKDMKEAQIHQGIQELAETVNELRATVERILANPPKMEEKKEEEDFTSRLKKTLTEAKELLKVLKEMGLIQEPVQVPEGAINLDEVRKNIELLKKLGYEVRPPPSYEDIKRLLEEERKRIMEEAEKKAMEKLKADEKRMTMVMNLVGSIIGAVMDTLKSKSEGGQLVSFAQQLAMRMAKGEQGGGEQGGT